jgi:hypothetical protein
MVRPPELTPQTQPQRGFTELFRLIRSLPSQSPDKSEVMGELCRIVRHLGSGIELGCQTCWQVGRNGDGEHFTLMAYGTKD